MASTEISPINWRIFEALHAQLKKSFKKILTMVWSFYILVLLATDYILSFFCKKKKHKTKKSNVKWDIGYHDPRFERG
jgi:hypothetical protein